MSAINFMIILSGVMLNAFAQLSLKAGTNSIGEITLSSKSLFLLIHKVIMEPFILLGLALYVVSVAIWIIALSKTPVGVAYPMLSMGYIVNMFLAYFLFGETITLQKIISISLIILGVLILAKA